MSLNYFNGNLDPLITLSWLKGEFKDLVIKKLNDQNRRRKLALYSGDKIPQNERNLTDSRNRVSLIIEYEFANIVTEIMQEQNIDSMFCSYVVANRFPDLEIRDKSGNLGLRFEVKCLQSIAEEKSANFSTLKKDIKPSTDFLTVFLWDWEEESFNFNWDRSPFVYDFFVFHAYELASLRDTYWLNSPPNELGNGFQGFDLRYAVNCRDGIYNEEEGNYGKLLRLWDKDFQSDLLKSEIIEQVEKDYLEFKDLVLYKGFEILSKRILPELNSLGLGKVIPIKKDNKSIGFYLKKYAFVFSLKSNKLISNLMEEYNLDALWVISSKYSWRKLVKEENKIIQSSKGTKPKTIIKDHFLN